MLRGVASQVLGGNAGRFTSLTVTAGAQITGASSGSTVATFTAFDATTTTLAVFERSGGAVSSRIRYDGSDGTISIGTSTAHPFSLFANNTERLRIDPTTGGITLSAYGTGGAVTTGAADSGGAGFKVLRVPN